MRYTRGFTLLEIVVALAIVVVLAVVSVSSYRHYVLISNRADAVQTLLSIQLAQEKYRLQNITYGTLGAVWGGTSTSEGGQYSIAISNVSATSYTISASATGSQTQDSACSTITLAYSNGTTTRTPAACWDED